MPRPPIEAARGWREKTMVGRDGAPLGRIVYLYLDRVTRQPAWALVATGPGGRRVFVPLVDAAQRQDQIHVSVERAVIDDAPAIRARRRLSKKETARLHGHYGGAPEPRRASARRGPGDGPSARLQQGLGQARERAVNSSAAASQRARLLLAAGAAGSSVIGGVLLARRRLPNPTRRVQPRRPRRRRRMAGNLKLVAGLAAGYVLGARAGRERYERIGEATRRLAKRPEAGGPEVGGRPEQWSGDQPSQAGAQPAAGERHATTRSGLPEGADGEPDGGGS